MSKDYSWREYLSTREGIDGMFRVKGRSYLYDWVNNNNGTPVLTVSGKLFLTLDVSLIKHPALIVEYRGKGNIHNVLIGVVVETTDFPNGIIVSPSIDMVVYPFERLWHTDVYMVDDDYVDNPDIMILDQIEFAYSTSLEVLEAIYEMYQMTIIRNVSSVKPALIDELLQITQYVDGVYEFHKDVLLLDWIDPTDSLYESGIEPEDIVIIDSDVSTTAVLEDRGHHYRMSYKGNMYYIYNRSDLYLYQWIVIRVANVDDSEPYPEGHPPMNILRKGTTEYDDFLNCIAENIVLYMEKVTQLKKERRYNALVSIVKLMRDKYPELVTYVHEILNDDEHDALREKICRNSYARRIKNAN